ncbi:hypothetical protein B0H34DRAFT_674968 [Crassisporium funariophilum]|nr:hypothetical protein B0H34DRAFT_674968 [Crassisporium funariophilum]
MVNGFFLHNLTAHYDRILPHLQCILKSVIGKQKKEQNSSSRDPDASKAIMSLSKNLLLLAQQAANDTTKVKMLPYDNFNWTARAWESMALHKSITHNKISALLTILQLPGGPDAPTACQLTDLLHFAQILEVLQSKCHIHIMQILFKEIGSFAWFLGVISAFEDSTAIPPRKTEEFYLPTFDQEQGSTQGNMVVLGHYFGKVLKIPEATFEHTMFTVLGDQLTTARDRAAQDQRAVDHLEHWFDHLSSLSISMV